MKKSIYLLLVVGLLAGCASGDLGGNVYSRDHARRAHTVKIGTIVALKEVRIEGTKSGIGAVSGAVLGAVVGNTIGSGSGKAVSQVGGAIAGTYAGSKVEEALSKQKGWEIIVDLENGNSVSIVQSATENWNVGERIRVLESRDGTIRVTKL